MNSPIKKSFQLYRHYDASGGLLYVGISNRFLERLQAHFRESGWAWKIKTITIDYFKTERAVRSAERSAIKLERPIWNKLGVKIKSDVSPVRAMTSFEAEKDVLLMLNKAQRRGVKISWLCNESLRRFLKDQGYGPRKEGK